MLPKFIVTTFKFRTDISPPPALCKSRSKSAIHPYYHTDPMCGDMLKPLYICYTYSCLLEFSVSV